ncbi:MAG: hypothetical protein KME18_08115 [Phormidium tanganyikae FI6-MK23]|jgi:hypothetical protein|nr:hypothetical protein [Phormidium tanganyikae FI6-MK23]
MSSEQKLVAKWRSLTPVKQQQVLNFVEHLKSEESDQSKEEILSPKVERIRGQPLTYFPTHWNNS